MNYATVAGIVISLGFSYVPGLSDYFKKQTPTVKRSILAAAIIVVAVAIVLGSCVGFDLGENTVSCDSTGVQAVLGNVVDALIGSQAAYTFTPSKHKEL